MKSKDVVGVRVTATAPAKKGYRTRKEAADSEQAANRDREYLLQRKEEQLLDTTSKLCRQISYSLNFRKRTFKVDATK